ncbi:MAG: ABC transporter ATP-binding protein [Acidimicrobiales bacterium]
MTEPLLELEGVSAGYGPFRALFGVSFAVPVGSAVALLGPNGAGKSTVARVATGLVPTTAGTIRFAGTDVTGLPAWHLARLGIAHAPEGRSVFASLTVDENLELTFRQSVGKASLASTMRRAYEAFPRLGERRTQLAGTLSGGEQRMLSLAKVLAHPPRLLVVDELSLGLAPLVIDLVFTTLRALRDAGTTLLVIEQHVGRALALADHVLLLGKGEVLRQGPTAAMADLAAQLVPVTERP